MPGKSFDENLTSNDLQELGSPDALTAFFARLGYNTNARLVQAPAALGIGQQDLIKAIEHSERLTEDGGLRVYLFKFNSVTKLLTDQLAKFFKARSGEFLLVLVDDYKELDFVLLRREPSEKDPAKLNQTQSKLTLDRRRPSPVALRVLRRITFTEVDSYAQFDKLKAAFDVAEWSEPHFNNRRLFTDHYLSHRLPEDEAWKEDPKAAFKRLAQAYATVAFKLAGMGATDLQMALFKPVFEDLGFSSFAADGASGAISLGVGGKTLVLALCYRWNRPLDAKDPGGDREDENPASKVVSVLEASDCAWAMVTNGKIWRLYSKHAHSRATNYYEVDLDEILTLDPAQDFDRANAFRYFWLLFRAKSLESGFLDRVLKDSQDYAKTLGDKLKKRVFEDVFPSLAEGFIQNIRSKDVALDDERLEEVKQGTLLLLYRLLFVLYAEALDLLPLRAEERGYGALSLRRLCREIADKAGMNLEQSKGRIQKSFEEDSFKGYKRLRELFRVINEGDATVNVPMYNGGLFADPAEDDEMPETKAARFLKKWRVNDRHLAEALDLLARAEDEKSNDLVNVDYKSLGVRQLGSIYEGLLEYVVCIADKKLVAVKEDNVVTYHPFSEMDEKQQTKALKKGRVISKEHVYLANNKSERKATGSYYTPDYIVEYIVENTVGPVLKKKFDDMLPRFREAQAWNMLNVKQAVAKGETKAKYTSGPAVETQWRELVESFFDIKVLDPAMGSGHFLVEAVDFITDKAIAFLDRFPWNPVQAHLAYTREQILAEMEAKGINLDRRKLDDINLLKRHVLKRCIYGVDLNRMAVELAKVSLWLDCFTLGAPLSFLDHHLKCGNSLLGSTVAEVDAIRNANQQLSIFSTGQWQGLMRSIEGMLAVGSLPDVTPEQASISKARFRGAVGDLAPFGRVLDIHAAQHFIELKVGLDRDKTAGKKRVTNRFEELLGDQDIFDWSAGKKGTSFDEPMNKVIVSQVASIASQKRFFHWELEFPEAFYGTHEQGRGQAQLQLGAGFDAVIGNPPYDVLSEKEQGESVDGEERFFEASPVFASSGKGKKNLYKLFIARGMDLTKKNEYCSYIVPMSLLADDQSSNLRKAMFVNCSPLAFEVFPQKDDVAGRVFEDAKLASAIFLLKNRKALETDRVRIRLFNSNNFSSKYSDAEISVSELKEFFGDNYVVPSCSAADIELLKKMNSWGGISRIGDYCQGHQGEVNETTDGANGLVHYRGGASRQRVLRGSNISLYVVRKASQGEDIFVNTKDFSAAKANTERLAHSRVERVGWQESSPQNNFRRVIASKIQANEFLNHKINYISESESKIPLTLLLAVLNSKLSDWYFRIISSNAAVSHYQISRLIVPTFRGVERATGEVLDLIKLGNVRELELQLLDLVKRDHGLGAVCAGVLVEICAKICELENGRELISRDQRSSLSETSQGYQDVIDRVLGASVGLWGKDWDALEKSLEGML